MSQLKHPPSPLSNFFYPSPTTTSSPTLPPSDTSSHQPSHFISNDNDDNDDLVTDSEPDSGFTVVASPHSFLGENNNFPNSALDGCTCLPRRRRSARDAEPYPHRKSETTLKKDELERRFLDLRLAREALEREEWELKRNSYPSLCILNDKGDDDDERPECVRGDEGHHETISNRSGSYSGRPTTRDVSESIKNSLKAVRKQRSTPTMCADGLYQGSPTPRRSRSKPSLPRGHVDQVAASGVEGKINSGYLYILGENRRWQKQEFRCDDRFLVCLRNEVVVPDEDESLPFLATFPRFAITARSALDDDINDEFQCSDSEYTVPTLNHALFATPSLNRNPLSPPTVQYYQKPIYVLRLSDVRRITLIARHGKVLERCFVLHATGERRYILRAESREEMKQWLFLLVRRTRRNAGERERNEMDEILKSTVDDVRLRHRLEDSTMHRDGHRRTVSLSQSYLGELHLNLRLPPSASRYPTATRDGSPQHLCSTEPPFATLPRADPKTNSDSSSRARESYRGTDFSSRLSTRESFSFSDLETLTSGYRTQILSRSYFLLNELGCASGFIPVVPAASSLSTQDLGPTNPALSESYIPVLLALQHLLEVTDAFDEALSSIRDPHARHWEAAVGEASALVRSKVRTLVGEGGLLASPRCRKEARDAVEALIDVFKTAA